MRFATLPEIHANTCQNIPYVASPPKKGLRTARKFPKSGVARHSTSKRSPWKRLMLTTLTDRRTAAHASMI
eukprot:CAMPEP_0171155164 /NCGR_PEP_ID=MMETSP0790-20130122/740_1 /TAXON_ID=2925 /ORGANISM="Alexandrium catenella, Strain OF101" /LENGTH=70 /DNA_ID=CAMNT_0011619337 /DNA_START=178 /DNA_END=387 /DNA_ORIENTATION=-